MADFWLCISSSISYVMVTFSVGFCGSITSMSWTGFVQSIKLLVLVKEQ